MANDRLNFYYDPTRQGYDTTLLKTITGVPSVTGGAIRMTSAKFISYADIFKEDLTLNIKIPTAPTAGNSRSWGLEQINIGAKVIFNITGIVFSVKCIYNGVTTSIVIPWLAAWTNTAVNYTIKWNGFSADFLINGVRPGGATLLGNFTETFINNASVPKVPLSMMVDNATADNMDVFFMEDQNVQGYI